MTGHDYPPEQERDVRLALRLGYTNALLMDSYDYDMHARNSASLILPERPFTRVGPLVIVHELVLDARGATIVTGRGDRLRTRTRVRLHPGLTPRALLRHTLPRPPKGWGGPPRAAEKTDRRGSRSQVRGVQDLVG